MRNTSAETIFEQRVDAPSTKTGEVLTVMGDVAGYIGNRLVLATAEHLLPIPDSPKQTAGSYQDLAFRDSFEINQTAVPRIIEVDYQLGHHGRLTDLRVSAMSWRDDGTISNSDLVITSEGIQRKGFGVTRALWALWRHKQQSHQN